MIKVRLVPDFLLSPNDSQDVNYIIGQDEKRDVFYIECSLPYIPAKGDYIDLASIRDDIFQQYSHLLLRFNKNLSDMINIIRNDTEKFILKGIEDRKNASNIDILRAIIYEGRQCDSVYSGSGIVYVDKCVYFPNDEYVYIRITWNL